MKPLEKAELEARAKKLAQAVSNGALTIVGLARLAVLNEETAKVSMKHSGARLDEITRLKQRIDDVERLLAQSEARHRKDSESHYETVCGLEDKIEELEDHQRSLARVLVLFGEHLDR
jgi:chromosome segregation ATPase